MYGDRWDGDGGLCRALLDGPSCHAALVNRLGDATAFQGVDGMAPIPWVHPETNLNAMWIDKGAGRLPPPEISESSLLLNYYCLDPASLLPVMALNLPHHIETESQPAKVLDMCAAPGGKTLAIMQTLFGGRDILPSSKFEENKSQHLVVANEVSRSRRIRLENVLAEYVPLPLQRSSLILTEMDGTAFGSASFDAQNGLSISYDTGSGAATDDDDGYTHVLCDVPCSGERHMLQSSSSLAEWNAGSSRHLQKKQLSLLKAAVAACRPGGIIVYSTCSINTDENDGVVEKLLHKRGDSVELRHDPLPNIGIGEETKYGSVILPDHASCEGMGPMFICTLSKRKDVESDGSKVSSRTSTTTCYETTTASPKSKQRYLHIAPDGDWWTGDEIFAAKHLEHDCVRSAQIPSEFDVEEWLELTFGDDDEKQTEAMQRIYDERKLPHGIEKVLK